MVHPLSSLAKKLKKCGEECLPLREAIKAIRIDINYELGTFSSGSKSEAAFRKLEHKVEKGKLRLDTLVIKIEMQLDRIDALRDAALAYSASSLKEQEFIADLLRWSSELQGELTDWADQIETVLEDVDRILAEIVLEVKN
ncbi:hypothetical protein [Tabrizicola sp. M-4]|uniref:hypothetical protein n=1 Tax=Tabrizicola sp. M-4 TaxID=3055847 RepID=UPI003DA989F9